MTAATSLARNCSSMVASLKYERVREPEGHSWSISDENKRAFTKLQSPPNGKNLAKCHFDRFCTFGRVQNLLKRDMKKAPQVGLEPTTLRLTEGFHVVAGSCGLLPTDSSFCIYRCCHRC